MPALSDYVAGTITLTNGSTDFTGTGTGWLAADFREGDTIFQVAGQTQWDAVIASITSNTAGTLALPWGGANGTYAYRMRYMADGARVTAQARNLIELLGNGNALAFAGLTGPGVVVFNGPHSMIVKPETDFVNGVFFNASVPNFAGRAAYNGQPGPTGNTPGFTVLVISDVNFDNKTTLYSKLSDTSGDWSTAAIITGDIGEMPTLDIGSTTTLPPGSTATVDINPVVGGYELDFGIPEGRGAKYVPGGYNPATTYTLDQAVFDNGSSWILIVAASTGNSPPVLPTTSNAYWSLLARKGTDGTGTGDFVGPALSIDNRLVAFDGTTGKLGKDAGILISDVMIKRTGSIIQTVSNYFSARAVATTGIPFDNTPPQSTEGDPLLSGTITPTSTTNKLRIRVALFGTTAGLANFIGALFVGTGTIGASAVATTISTTPGADYFQSAFFEYEYTPGTVSGQAISVRVGPAGSGSFFINGTTTGDLFGGGKFRCSIIIEEIQA